MRLHWFCHLNLNRLPSFVATYPKMCSTACLFSLAVLWRNRKLFASRVFVLLRLFFLNDATTSLFMVICNAWHVHNNVRGIAELFRRSVCFRITGLQYFFVLKNSLITLLIGLDRLQFSPNPIKQSPSRPKYPTLRCLQSRWWFLPGRSCSVAPFTQWPCWMKTARWSTPSCCTARAELQPGPGRRWSWLSLLITSIFSVSVYLYILIGAYCVRVKIAPTATSAAAAHSHNGVEAIHARMLSKLSRNITVTTTFHLLVGPLPGCFSTLLAKFLPDKVLSIGVYCSWLTLQEGTLYTTMLLLTADFRDEFPETDRVEDIVVNRLMSIE